MSEECKVLILIVEFKLHSACLWCFSSPVMSIKFNQFAVGWLKVAGNLKPHHCGEGKYPLFSNMEKPP